MKISNATLVPLATFLVILMIVPAEAAPTLSLESNASYDLDASVDTFESCTSSDPAAVGIACGGTAVAPNFGFVAITDNNSCSYGDPSCQFSPQEVSVGLGGSVNWQGGNLTHTVTSDTLGAFDFTVFAGGFRQNTFSSPGTFSYHCSFHPWMTGTVSVIGPPVPPPQVRSYTINGTLGWLVLGLDDDDAILEVNHRIDIFNATISPPMMIRNASGTFEQTIELATREESPPILSLLQLASTLNSPVLGGPGYAFPGPAFSYGYGFQPPKFYTIWWVDGPIREGSPVQLLAIYAAVRASRTIDLGPELGTREAWTVGTRLIQAFNQTEPLESSSSYFCFPYGGFVFVGSPQPRCYVAGSSNSVTLEFDYGKQSDLLFASSNTIDAYTKAVAVYPPGSRIYGPTGGPGFQVTETVTVTRITRVTLSISFSLTSTNLDLSRRMAPPSQNSQQSGTSSGDGPPPSGSSIPPNSNPDLTVPWMYAGIGAAAALIIGGGTSAYLRGRRRTLAVTGATI